MYKFTNHVDEKEPIKVRIRGYIDNRGDFVVEYDGSKGESIRLLVIYKGNGKLYRLTAQEGCPLPLDKDGKLTIAD